MAKKLEFLNHLMILNTRLEWFDLDLLTCDLKIKRDHLLIKGNPCTEFGIDKVKGSKDIKRTTLGLQTNRPTDRQLQNNMPPFSRGA